MQSHEGLVELFDVVARPDCSRRLPYSRLIQRIKKIVYRLLLGWSPLVVAVYARQLVHLRLHVLGRYRLLCEALMCQSGRDDFSWNPPVLEILEFFQQQPVSLCKFAIICFKPPLLFADDLLSFVGENAVALVEVDLITALLFDDLGIRHNDSLHFLLEALDFSMVELLLSSLLPIHLH